MEEVVQGQVATPAQQVAEIFKQKNLEAAVLSVEVVLMPLIKAKAASTATPIDDAIVSLVEQEVKKFLASVVK